MLKEKRILITGASSGIGKVISESALAEGARVYGCGLEEASGIVNKRFTYQKTNLADFGAAETIAAGAERALSGLDILINCAGVTGVGVIETTPPAEFRRQFEINVFALYNITKAALPALKRGIRPNIVNIGSELGMRVGAERIAYGPAKAAVHMLTQCLAVDCAPLVRVNAVMPGLTETPMTKTRFAEAEDPEAYRNRIRNRYPLKRMCTPEDVANAVMFLASDKAANITGELMAVCGGGHVFINNA